LDQAAPLIAIWAMVGSLGFITGGLRTLAVLIMGKEETGMPPAESLFQRIYLFLGMLALLAVGLFPQSFLPLFANLPHAFEQLAP
jgi:hypothetical protein